MSVLPVGFGSSSSGIDTGDIPASLRFRSSASAYLSKTITTDATSTYFAAVKRGKLGVISPIFDTNIKFNANDTLTAFGLTTTAVFRDPTSWLFIHVSNGGLYINGVSYGAVTTSALTNPRIGFDGTNYFDGYFARIGCVAGSSSAYTNFGAFNTEINEWVSKSQSEVKAVVDAGGTNSFMLDFDDATSLTTLGYDKSSKGNNWTLNNFSLYSGSDQALRAQYDHMLDVPGNSYATLNRLKVQGTPTLADGNLSHTRTAVASRSPGSISIGASDLAYFEFVRTDAVGVGNNVAFGIAATDSALSTSQYGGAPTSSGATANEWVLVDRGYACNGSTYTNLTATLGTFGQNDVGRVAINRVTGKVWFGKNATWSGDPAAGTGEAFSNVTVDVQPLSYVYSGTLHFNTGQRPLAQTAPTGFKAPCQRNMPDPAILNPKNGFVSVLATEDNIYSTLASARSGWTDYVDILKNRAASESWAWQFSHDSSNEYAVAASSLVRQTKRTQSGSNNWVGYSIRVGATYGTAAGSVSHTNGVATTITHNVGKSARQLILLFNRAGGSAVPVYHPDLTSGELLDLCTTTADAASTAITSVGTNSFQIGSATASGTYDYLVCSEISQFFDLGKWTGNASADGAYYDAGHKPKMLYAKALSTTDDHRVYDDLRPGYNVQGGVVLANTNAAETTTAEMDITAFGMKARITTTPNAAQTYVTASWASSSGKYSLGR